MGSVGEDDSQPSSCKTLLDGCGAANHASVPKKLRSAIKKRGRESITLCLPIPKKKKHHTSNEVDTLGKDRTNKSKLNKKKGHITKDEEEVAETLYSLAGMFADAKEANQPGFDEQQETKSSAVLQEGDSINAAGGEESRKTGSEVMIEAASHSSTADVVKSQSVGAQQPKLEPAPIAAVFESSLCLGSRPPVSILGMAPLGEREIDLEQKGVSGVQYGTNDKCKDKFLSPTLSATGAPSSETQKSCSRFPALFESPISSSQPRVTENSITTEKVQYAPVSVVSKNSWKRCTAHVYLSRLIKVMQISERKESLPEKQQIPIINGRNSGASSSGIQKESSEIQNDILLHKRPVQDQQMATETSALCSFKQGYDFLSLGTGGSVNKRDNSAIQYHAPYMQSQDHTAMLFPLPQNGHSSTFHTHNSAFPTQQVPQYQSSFTAQTEQQLAAQLQTYYNNRIGGTDSASVLNYAHALFPHLNAALAAKYQQLLPSQPQFLPLNNTLPLLPMRRLQHHLPLGFERNPENIPHLQLHHLRNR